MALKNLRTNQRLNGQYNVISYIGVNPVDPPEFVSDNRPPTVNDSKNFLIGTLWLDTTGYPQTLPTASNVWMLVALVGNNATWVNFGSGTVTHTSGNDLVNVFPDNTGKINIVGDGTYITVNGTPGTHTETITLVNSGHYATTYHTQSGNAVPSANILNIYGANGLTTSGTGNTVTVTAGGSIAQSFPTDSGTATPSAGVLNILAQNATLGCGSSVLFSAPGTSNTVQLNVTDALGNTIIGLGSGSTGITGLGANTVVGGSAGSAITSGSGNTFIGYNSGLACTTSTDSTGVGLGALLRFTTGSANTGANNAFGAGALQFVTTGIHNSGLGDNAGSNGTTGITTGSYNTFVGSGGVGGNYTSSESSNILLGYSIGGTNGESNVIRVGVSGSGTGQQNKCFVAGIRGITTTNNNAIAVLIDSAGQLGTVSSSITKKKNIEDMKTYSEYIYDLRPVTFAWKDDESEHVNPGLIAEEVDKLCPGLCAYDGEGKPSSVKYHDLPILLLNEIQKLRRRIEDLENK